MDREELRKLDLTSITSEEARRISMEFLEDSIDETKLTAKRFGFVTGILTAGSVIGTIASQSPAMYGVLGLDAYFINVTVQKLLRIAREKKVLKSMRNNEYTGDYISFVSDCQEYLEKYHPVDENTKTK